MGFCSFVVDNKVVAGFFLVMFSGLFKLVTDKEYLLSFDVGVTLFGFISFVGITLAIAGILLVLPVLKNP